MVISCSHACTISKAHTHAERVGSDVMPVQWQMGCLLEASHLMRCTF